jgi:hypothetical protein
MRHMSAVPRILDSLGVPIERSPAEAEVLASAAGDGLPRHHA